MSENDVKLLSVRRADDDSGWHVVPATAGVALRQEHKKWHRNAKSLGFPEF
jgi:hypothetical protein